MTPKLDRQTLIHDVHRLIDLLRPVVDGVSVLDWDGSDGFLPIVRRSAIRRQFESLETMLTLTRSDRADSAVGLLRPACEELLWLRYLNRQLERDARELIDCMLPSGILHDLEAQAGEVGEDTMADMGLAVYLVSFKKADAGIRERLKSLGRKLEWPQKSIKRGDVPSTWFIAQQTDSKDIYRFLYHATSRYVHFSVSELARRGWGHPGRLELSSRHYEPIWAFFCLCWGGRLLGMTLNESSAVVDRGEQSRDDEARLQSAFSAVLSVPLIPIVTPDELVWDATPVKNSRPTRA